MNSKEEKPRKVELNQEQRDRLKRMSTDLPGLLEYAHTAGGFQIKPTKEGVIKSASLKAAEQQANKQMQQIMDQMQLLAKQAQGLKTRLEVSQKIYQARMSFKPVIGGRYYLYRRQSSEMFLSMIEPDMWGLEKKKQLTALASVELLADHTWDIIESYEEI